MGAAVTTYAIDMCRVAFAREATTATLVITATVAAVLMLVTVAHACVAFLFLRRVVSAIDRGREGWVLDARGPVREVTTPNIRKVRSIGEQFSRDESRPAYVVFVGAGGLWICSAEAFPDTTTPR